MTPDSNSLCVPQHRKIDLGDIDADHAMARGRCALGVGVRKRVAEMMGGGVPGALE